MSGRCGEEAIANYVCSLRIACDCFCAPRTTRHVCRQAGLRLAITQEVCTYPAKQ